MMFKSAKWSNILCRYWLLTTAFLLLLGMLFIRPYAKHNVIQHDVTSYYTYLPAAFIHKDITSYDFVAKGKPFVWVENHPEGFKHLKMTSGVALLWLPFFSVANLLTPNLDSDFIHGYEWPFQLSISIAALCYCLLGLWLLKRFLSEHVAANHAVITCWLLLFGSNLLYYTVVSPGMSHVYSFFLLCLLLDRTKNGVNSNTSWFSLFFIGLIFGWIVLIRPVNVLLVFGVLLVQLSLGKRVQTSRILPLMLYGALGAVMICLPQLAYWYHVSGFPVLYSYGDEGFYLKLGNVFKGWFGFRKGAVWYSPVLLLLAFTLIPFVWKKLPKSTLSIIILTSGVFGAIVFSWWCWWYGGGFGARVLVEWYPLIAILLAWIVAKLWSKWVFRVVALTLMVYSIYFSWQANLSRLHYDAMTPKAYAKLLYFNAKGINGADLFPPDYYGAKHFGEELHYGTMPVSYVRPDDLYSPASSLKEDIVLPPSDTSYQNVHVWSKVKHFSTEPIFLVLAAHNLKTNELITAVQVDINEGPAAWVDKEVGLTPNFKDTVLLKRYIHNPNKINHVVFFNQ